MFINVHPTHWSWPIILICTLIIPKQCKTISEGINGSSVFINYEVSLQFYWEWVKSLKGARSRGRTYKRKSKGIRRKLSKNAVT